MSEDSLPSYFGEIRRFPVLEAQEEIRLAKQWRDKGDSKAADRLIKSHLRLVAKIASRYRGYGLPLSDLIAEGHIGIIQAVRRFDPERGVRLSTYAMWWIRASIQEYILRSWSLVKIGTTASQKKLFFKLRSLKNRLKEMDDEHLSSDGVTHIAEVLSVSEQEVINMNARISAPDRSLNTPLRDDSDSEWIDWIVDDQDNPELMYGNWEELSNRRSMLEESLNHLNERERFILSERRLKDNPCTLEELSLRFGISRERVRQVEVRAFEKLRRAVRALDRKQRLAN